MDNPELYEKLENRKIEYLQYRGSSFDKDGNLLWAKDSAESWIEGFDEAVSIIKKVYKI